MKWIYITLCILMILSACKKDNQSETQNETNLLNILQLSWNAEDPIDENDTISALLGYVYYVGTRFADGLNYYQPVGFYENYTFEWNINDETSDTTTFIILSFQSNGIKKITLTAKYLDEERIFIFYVKANGCLITSGGSESNGLFIDESDNGHRTLFTNEGNEMVGYEYINFELQSRKIMDQYQFLPIEIMDFSKDINGYLNAWTWHEFYKFDKHANLVFEITSFASLAVGHIYISSENKYNLLGINSYNAYFYHFDQDGGNFETVTLHDNYESTVWKDGLMLSDSICILLVENNEEEITQLVKFNLITTEENTLMTLPDNYNRIIRANDGYIIYTIGGGSIAYLNQNLDLLWDTNIEFHTKMSQLKSMEFQNSFLFINRRELISISKSGELNFVRSYYDETRFMYRSIATSSGNALILADYRNYNNVYHEEETYGTIMFIIDEAGNIVE